MQNWGTMLMIASAKWDGLHTSNAGEELSSKALDLTARKGHKSVALEKVEDALAKKVCDDANMITKVKAVP